MKIYLALLLVYFKAINFSSTSSSSSRKNHCTLLNCAPLSHRARRAVVYGCHIVIG